MTLRLGHISVCLLLVFGANANGQHQKHEQPQSAPIRPEGGFAAGPRSGVVAGETRSVGLEGIEIDFPTVKIKLPSIRIPGLTQYRRGARMFLENDVAPYIPANEVRQEFSIEAGPGDNPRPMAPELGPSQPNKAYQHSGAEPAAGNGWPQGEDVDHRVAQRIQQLQVIENRLDAKLERLAVALEQVAELQSQAIVRSPPLAANDTELRSEAVHGVAPVVIGVSQNAPMQNRLDTAFTSVERDTPSLLERIDKRLSSFFGPSESTR